MRILITGGAGCLGAALVEHLLPAGHELLIIDNFATGKRGNLPDDDGVRSSKAALSTRNLSIAPSTRFAPTCVIHSAASYKDPNDWLEDGRTNVIGTIHVANAARRMGVKRVLNFQTALCYGRTEQVPIPQIIRYGRSPATAFLRSPANRFCSPLACLVRRCGSPMSPGRGW